MFDRQAQKYHACFQASKVPVHHTYKTAKTALLIKGQVIVLGMASPSVASSFYTLTIGSSLGRKAKGPTEGLDSLPVSPMLALLQRAKLCNYNTGSTCN